MKNEIDSKSLNYYLKFRYLLGANDFEGYGNVFGSVVKTKSGEVLNLEYHMNTGDIVFFIFKNSDGRIDKKYGAIIQKGDGGLVLLIGDKKNNEEYKGEENAIYKRFESILEKKITTLGLKKNSGFIN